MSFSTTSDIAPEFTDEQLALAEVSSDVFEKGNAPARLREFFDGDAPARWADTSLWGQVAEIGLAGIGIDERHGGMGSGATTARDLQLTIEAAGAACVPEPFGATVGVVAPLLAGAEHAASLADTWLPRIAAGEATAVAVTADTVADASSSAPIVAGIEAADLLVVLHPEQGAVLHVVEDLALAPVATEDRTRRVAIVAGEPTGGVALTTTPAQRDRALARVLWAESAELVGVCRRMTDLSVEYAKVRTQFNTPIGAFQAVQHLLATMHTEAEAAVSASRMAARAIDLHDADMALHAAIVAKAAACRLHGIVNRDALQVHGGIGFTWEHDLHLWLKRGAALSAASGGLRAMKRRLADHLFA